MIAALLFITIAAALFLHSLWQVLHALESRTWPSVPGEVIAVNVEEDRGPEATKYRPAITYRFRAGGEERTGTRAFYGDATGYAFAWKFVKRYPARTAVKVHYDPANAAETVLEPGVKWPLAASFLVRLALVALGIIALVSAAGAPGS
jgi:hypothetical protein